MDWMERAEPYRQAIEQHLSETLLPDLGKHLVSSHYMTPLALGQQHQQNLDWAAGRLKSEQTLMGLSLYDITIATSVQTLDGLIGVLEKGKNHCESHGIALDEIVASTLIEGMHGFGFQVLCSVHHSLGSIEGVMNGEFRPPQGPFDLDYETLQARVAEARAALAGYDEEAVNARLGATVEFVIGERRLPFTAEDFVLSFSHPNLFFHATTAYGLLRTRGVPLGKRDFMGPLRIQR